MNAYQISVLATGHAVSDTLEMFTATSDLAAFRALHTALKTKLQLIASLAATQALPTTGHTVDRDRVMGEATETALLVAGSVLSYANANQLGELAAKVRLTRSDFTRTRLGQRALRARQVHDAAREVLPQLAGFGVTAPILDDLLAKVEAAEAISHLPRAALMTRRVATEKLAATFREIWDLLRHQIDPLMTSQRKANPDAYALYRAARVVIARPGSPTPVFVDAPPTPSAAPVTPTIAQPKAACSCESSPEAPRPQTPGTSPCKASIMQMPDLRFVPWERGPLARMS